VVSESRVPILVFLGLSVLDLGLMYATDRQTSDNIHRFMLYKLLGAITIELLGAGHNKHAV